MSGDIKTIFKYTDRINLTINDIEEWTDAELKAYRAELSIIAQYIIEQIMQNSYKNINVLTDIMYTGSMINCNAGVSSISLAPNGKFYICPTSYMDNPEDHLGSLDEGLNNKYRDYLTLEMSPVCTLCDAYHCKRCVYLNKKLTGEFPVPSKNQCVVTHIEKEISLELQKEFLKIGRIDGFRNILVKSKYEDPLILLQEKRGIIHEDIMQIDG